MLLGFAYVFGWFGFQHVYLFKFRLVCIHSELILNLLRLAMLWDEVAWKLGSF